MKYHLSLFLFLLVACIGRLSAQTFTRSQLKFGIGLSSSTNTHAMSFGYNISVGYQREFWNQRLRLNPNFSYGLYGNQNVQDAGDIYFNSLNLQCILYGDLIRGNGHSFFLGAGLAGNNSRGLDAHNSELSTRSPEFFSEYNAAILWTLGYRYNKPAKRIAWDISPVALQIGTNEHVEVNLMKISMDIKL